MKHSVAILLALTLMFSNLSFVGVSAAEVPAGRNVVGTVENPENEEAVVPEEEEETPGTASEQVKEQSEGGNTSPEVTEETAGGQEDEAQTGQTQNDGEQIDQEQTEQTEQTEQVQTDEEQTDEEQADEEQPAQVQEEGENPANVTQEETQEEAQKETQENAQEETAEEAKTSASGETGNADAAQEPAAESEDKRQDETEEKPVEEVVVKEVAEEAKEAGVSDGWNSAHTKFFENGKAVTGFKTIGGARYFFTDSGRMVTGFRTISGARYYFQNSSMKGFKEANKGKMVTGFKTIKNKTYYFTNSRISGYKSQNEGKAVKAGWRTISGKRYYFEDYGRQKGWKTINGKTYYLKSNGVMVTGIKTIKGSAYYFGKNGVMRTGWVKIGSVWAYYKDNGKAGKQGWKQKDDEWFYLKKNGKAKTGWKKLNAESIFYLNKADGGAMVTGPFRLPTTGKYYFFDEDGRRATSRGWKTYGEYSYFTYKSGIIAVNKTIDGVKIGPDGKVKGSLLDIKASGYSSNTNYLILVNRGEHLVAVFKGKKNNWTKVKGDWLCTIGAYETPTPAGVFKTYGPTGRTEYGWMDFQYTSAAFCTGVTAGFFFHTILYQKGWRGNPYSAPVEDGELGVNHSKSCVRLKPENAEWVRKNVPSGTTVVVYN